MRRMGLVAMCFALISGGAQSTECATREAVEAGHQAPAQVMQALSAAGLRGYQVIEKQVCPGKVRWLAIPSEWKNKPGPPDVEELVVQDRATEKAIVVGH
jgi:hypothetical protein